MFKIDVPHPLGNREFATRVEAARLARAFGLDARKIVPVDAAPTAPQHRAHKGA